MDDYCKKYPDICLRYRENTLGKRDYLPEGKRLRRTLAEGKVYNTEYLLRTNRPPDAYTQKLLGEGYGVISRNLKTGSQVMEHTPKEVLNAYLSQGAYENAYKSTNEAEAYIRKGSKLVPELKDISIIRNPRFTNNNHTAYRNNKTGEVYLAYRGSDGNFHEVGANLESVARNQKLRFKNSVDWGVNLHTLAGQEHTTKRYKDAVKVARELALAYNKPHKELNLTGDSLGGGQADFVAETLGAKSVSFSPARNPLANRPVHPDAKIESHSTLFDPVSMGRNIHEKVKGTPNHIKHKLYPASLGNGEGLVNQHILEKQFINPLRKEGNRVVSTRLTPLRNTIEMLGDFKGKENLTNLVAPYALTPEYENKIEKGFRVGENYADTLKMTTALSKNLFRVNPAFALLDSPSMMADVMSIDPILPPEAKNWVRSKIGLPIPKMKYTPPPKIIQTINKSLDKITGRYTADQHLRYDMELADKLGLTLDEYLNISHGKGFEDPEKDMGIVFSDDQKRIQEQERHTHSALQYSTQEAHELGQKYHEDRS